MKAVNQASAGREIANWNCKKATHKLTSSCNSEICKSRVSYMKSAASEFFTVDELESVAASDAFQPGCSSSLQPGILRLLGPSDRATKSSRRSNSSHYDELKPSK
jgi:hypothetical protein